MKHSKVVVISTLMLSLQGCAMLGAVASAASSMFGGSGTGNSSVGVNTTLKTQVGDGSSGVGAESNKANVDKMGDGSSVAGKDSYKIEGGNVIINQSSWKDLIIIAIMAFVVVAVVFLHVPQPKYMLKLKKKNSGNDTVIAQDSNTPS